MADCRLFTAFGSARLCALETTETACFPLDPCPALFHMPILDSLSRFA